MFSVFCRNYLVRFWILDNSFWNFEIVLYK